MELSRTSHLALRAALYLASNCEHAPLPRDAIARALAAPENYLAKVLNRLRIHGIVLSKTGPGGGYRLARRPSEIALIEILKVFESKLHAPVCLLGGRSCDLDHPCQAHHAWQRLSERTERVWASSRLSDLVDCPDASPEPADTVSDLLPTQGAPR